MTEAQEQAEILIKAHNGVEGAKITAQQICKLAGLPMFQVVFWKEVNNEIDKKGKIEQILAFQAFCKDNYGIHIPHRVVEEFEII